MYEVFWVYTNIDCVVSAISVTGTLVLPESGSETDDEGSSNLPPETLVFEDDDGNVTQTAPLILSCCYLALLCLPLTGLWRSYPDIYLWVRTSWVFSNSLLLIHVTVEVLVW